MLALLRSAGVVVAPHRSSWPVVAAVVLVLAFPSALQVDLGSSKSLNKATSGRCDLIEGGAASCARDRPVAGWGSGSFQAQFRRHEHASGREATSASHTIPITVAAEQGAIGLLAYLALLVARAGAAAARRARAAPARAAIGGRLRRAARCTPGCTPRSSRIR